MAKTPLGARWKPVSSPSSAAATCRFSGIVPRFVQLRKELGPCPLAHARPFLDVKGRELVRVVQEHVGLELPLQLVVVRNGQLVLIDAAERFRFQRS